MSGQLAPSSASTRLLATAQRLQALAQAGIAYQTNAYDLERYLEISALSSKLLQEITDEPFEKIVRVFTSDTGYQTPKVDVRGVLFRGTDEILMIREKIDQNRWSLPGGWADVGYSPFEVAAKEVQEEAGLLVKPVRLLAVFDKGKHAHPPHPWYVYKLFVLCEEQGGELLRETPETTGAQWIRRSDLASLELSTERVTPGQLETMFAFARNPELPAMCD